MRAEHQLLVEYKRRIDALVERVNEVRSENQTLRAENESLRTQLRRSAEREGRDLDLIRGLEQRLAEREVPDAA